MTDVSKRHRTSWPKAAWVFSDPGRMLMFGMGSGLLRPGSGTWATLLAWLLWSVASRGVSDLYIGLFLLVCFVYGCGRGIIYLNFIMTIVITLSKWNLS
jgi:phosphatidylglycerophosphatase A